MACGKEYLFFKVSIALVESSMEQRTWFSVSIAFLESGME